MSVVYHVTSQTNAELIKQQGLKEGSYWTNDPEIADYYASVIEDDGETPFIITAQVEDLCAEIAAEFFFEDNPSLQEPITTVLGKSEEEVWDEWEASAGGWRGSLSVVGSFKIRAPVPVAVLRFQQDAELTFP